MTAAGRRFASYVRAYARGAARVTREKNLENSWVKLVIPVVKLLPTERSTTERNAPEDTMSYDTLVAEVTARPNGPTKKQIDFLFKLAGERVDVKLGSDGEERIENAAAWLENGATGKQTSNAIAHLLKQPIDEREVAVPVQRGAVQPQPKVVDPGLTPGVYDVDGHVYVVKFNREKTRMYAKHIVELASSDRLNAEGERINIDFVYEAGAIYTIKPEHRMSFDDAKVLTIRYGRCINCGRTLKAGKSVEQGIGPVCRKQFA